MNEVQKRKVNFVKEELLNDKFLTDIGFKFQKEEFEKDELSGDSYSFIFKNVRAARSLEFNFTPDYEGQPYFIVYIHDPDNKTLDVDAYCKKHKIRFQGDLDPFNLVNFSGNFEQQIKQFLGFLDRLFKEKMLAILSGQVCEEIPFDWHGYK